LRGRRSDRSELLTSYRKVIVPRLPRYDTGIQPLLSVG